MNNQISAYRWIIAWVVLGLLLWAFSRLRIGYTLIYYLAVLLLLLLVLTQYEGIVTLLSPFNQLSNQEVNNG